MKIHWGLLRAMSRSEKFFVAGGLGLVAYASARPMPLERLIVAGLGLLILSIGYDRFVGQLEERGQDHGYTAFLVVAGVGYVLAALALVLGLTVALYGLALFAAAGAPMTLGSMRRYQRQREAETHRASAEGARLRELALAIEEQRRQLLRGLSENDDAA